jgi:hypothetical protein
MMPWLCLTYIRMYMYIKGKGKVGTAVGQWLKVRATNRKVVGSIPDGVIGNFH